MIATKILDIIDALQEAKQALVEAFQEAKDGEEDEEYLGAFAILSDECLAFHQLYEKENLR